MKINRLLILAALPMIGLTANAQEKGPQRNDFTVAATVSYDATVMQNASPGYYTRICVWASKEAGSSSTSGNWCWEAA